MIDNTDKAILKLLQKDAKMTIKEIAAKLNLTSTPIYERIKKLENECYIQSYRAILDRSKVGLDLKVYCTVSLNVHETKSIAKFEKDIQKLNEVYACYHIAGMFDYLLEIYVRDMEEYQSFVSAKLASLTNIGRVQSAFVMSEVKSGGILSF